MLSRDHTLKVVQADLGEVARYLRHADDALHLRGLYSNPRKHARQAIVALEEMAAKLQRAFLPEEA